MATITLLDKNENSAKTWIWNYCQARFVEGQKVEVVGSSDNIYLRSDADNILKDNIGHMVDFKYIK